MLPLQIEHVGSQLQVTWQDGTVSRIGAGSLRRACPCTACGTSRHRRTDRYLPMGTVQTATIVDLELIGSSALRVIWDDGHALSLYPYHYLRELAPPGEPDDR